MSARPRASSGSSFPRTPGRGLRASKMPARLALPAGSRARNPPRWQISFLWFSRSAVPPSRRLRGGHRERAWQCRKRQGEGDPFASRAGRDCPRACAASAAFLAALRARAAPALASASIKRLLTLDRELGESVQDAGAIDAARLDHAISELTAILGEAVFGEVPDEWLKRHDTEDLALWARRNETEAQTIFEYLVRTGMADAGAAEVSPLPAMTPESLPGNFADRAPGCLRGAAGMAWASPRTTPLSRLAARPSDQIREAALSPGSAGPACSLPRRACGNPGADAGAGGNAWRCGACRGSPRPQLRYRPRGRRGRAGRLIHAVEIADGVVKRYRILAPTEWNFHPQGAAAKGLHQASRLRRPRAGKPLRASA